MKWTVYGHKRQNPIENGYFRMDYHLGPKEPITTSTPLSTTTTPLSIGEVQVYIIAVNEREFVNSSLEELWIDIQSLNPACAFLRTPAKSCVDQCDMSSNPERGCVTFNVLIPDSILCQYGASDLKNDMDHR